MSAIPIPTYELHTLGWKAFQDLCVSVAQECLNRPVQFFLPSKDGGRDGAFVGSWASGSDVGRSTIQCKYTSLPHEHLSASMLSDELTKVQALVARGLATDYIIITNHPISGTSEQEIAGQFQAAGVKRCRVFGRDWLVGQIQESARLRMLVPRLYGLGDLSQILDERAYEQASMILSAMGDDLKKLVITDAHRRSVEAISRHNFVLLLGAPAAGKSTIGAGLAVGAADIWKSLTLRATTPEQVEQHLNPREAQFFWIDDAWGSTQYQRDSAESWNRILPLMQAAVKRGTRFLLTSRDYIWERAKGDLKLHAFPLLNHSQVVINVQKLAESERAQILFNHIRMGDQPQKFRTRIKPFLPALATRGDFLPETARRLGSSFFAGELVPSKESLERFFAGPQDFLFDTISGLDAASRAAVALIYLSGGTVSSPISENDLLKDVASAFGVVAANIRDALNALNGSLAILAHNEQGRYWTYKHPTIGDAFSRYVAANPEYLRYFLRGAKPETIMQEVICGDVELAGASVRVMLDSYDLLEERLRSQPIYNLRSFVSYRADRAFAERIIRARPDLLKSLRSFAVPVAQDPDTALLCRLHKLGLLPDELRRNFVEKLKEAVIEQADASMLEDDDIASVLSDEEESEIFEQARVHVLGNVPAHLSRVKSDWDSEYPPDEQFDELRNSIQRYARAVLSVDEAKELLNVVDLRIRSYISDMQNEYTDPPSVTSPLSSASQTASPYEGLFRDVDA